MTVRVSVSRWVAGLLVGLLAITIAGAAGAAPTTCTDPYVKSQQLRNRGKLVAARGELQQCVQNCSGTFLVECKQWIQEVDHKLPTIVVRAETPAGDDLRRTKVSIDGVETRSELDGKPIPVDVGSHLVKLEAEGYVAVEREIVGVEGESGRILAVTMQPTNRAAPPLATGETPPPTTDSSPSRPIPLPVFILGGVALVGVAGFTVFGLRGNANRRDLDSQSCAPHCPAGDADRMDRNYLIADIALGVGVVAAAAAVVLYLVRPTVAVAHH